MLGEQDLRSGIDKVGRTNFYLCEIVGGVRD